MNKTTYCKDIDESNKKYSEYIRNHIKSVMEAYHTAEDAFKEVFPEVYSNESQQRLLMFNLRDHDMSKFDYKEFWPYLSKFFPYEGMTADSNTVENNFNIAWLHHVHNNEHHPAHWALAENNIIEIFDMPDIYIIEMLCDWMAMSKYYNSTTLEYWNSPSAQKLPMSIRTISKVDKFMDWMRDHNVHTLW